ncbi:MAG TPA: hypothetical protein VFH04_01390 [Nitrososphaeraceae archaeon]|nr:hypothetical protein [Nitrososphaeraceae archaeon]
MRIRREIVTLEISLRNERRTDMVAIHYLKGSFCIATTLRGSHFHDGKCVKDRDRDHDHDIIIRIRNEVNDIFKVSNNPADFEVDLVAIDINSDGSAMKCLMDVNRVEANCEEFSVPENTITGSFKVFVAFESGAKDRAAQNSYLKSLKDNINDINFIEDNVDNVN